ncbi:MAG: right-handed parallel beta-helix repeat-containing protein [Planctomycetes bacterium]|nr:right-handed parallel beta-helix repeat-containing protein [Planctomycetota bacterium]
MKTLHAVGAHVVQPLSHPIFRTILAVLLPSLATAQAAVVFVDGRVAACGDGVSWATAYKYLQDALAAARAPGSTITEIWVAGGTYRPDRDCAHSNGTGDRNATFQLVDRVALRGGFGGTEDLATFNLADRDLAANETILSGDLAGDDGPDFTNNGENCYHVTTGDGTSVSAVLDGFTITGGNADGVSPSFTKSGGGMYNDHGHPTIVDCTFRGNSAVSGGGGLHNVWSGPTLTHCLFSGNRAGHHGGGVSTAADSALALTDCAFTKNSALWGGGLFENTSTHSSRVMNCTFSQNTASDQGGGLNLYSGRPVLINCVFAANAADHGGGLVNLGTDGSLINCVFVGNQAPSCGGGVCNGNRNLALVNCILWNNSPAQIGDYGSLTVDHSCIQGGWTGTGNIDADPLFIQTPTAGPDATWGTDDDDLGDLQLQGGSPCIDAGNNAAVPGDVLTDLAGRPRRLEDWTTADCRWAPGTCGAAPIVDIGAYEFSATGIAGRYVFYNNSRFDEYGLGIDPISGPYRDDAAIDPGKSPLFVGDGMATFVNWTGYLQGLNGLMYDVGATVRPPVIDDFVFHDIGRAGTTSPGIPVTPTGFLVRPGAGVGGSDRVVITFASTRKPSPTGTVISTWLQVDIGTGFGLDFPETHWWGNAAGDVGVGNPPPNVLVNPTDELDIRKRLLFASVLAPPVTPDDRWDVDKDGYLLQRDEIFARSRRTTPFDCVKMIVR